MIIIGAGGYGKVIADITLKCGYTNIVFLDDNMDIKSCGRYYIVGNNAKAKDINEDMIVAIGDSVV